MVDFFKLIIPFLSVTKNYDETLQRLSILAFYQLYGILWFLGSVPQISDLIKTLDSSSEIGTIITFVPYLQILNPFALGGAVILAVLSNIFHLHDRISDLLGIRRRFDLNHILVPLAELVGASGVETKKARIASKRDTLMRAVFYKYASSRSDKPLVDRHDIEHALSAWSWFWVFEETILYFGTGAIVALCLASVNLALIFAGIAIASLILACLQYPRLRRYARPQIESIAADAAAAAHVKQQFDAL